MNLYFIVYRYGVYIVIDLFYVIIFKNLDD